MLAIAVWASGAAWADDRADFSDAYRSYEKHLAANDTERERMGGLERTVRIQMVETLEELGQRDAATGHLLLLGAHQDWSPEVEPVYRSVADIPVDVMKKRIKGEVTLCFTVDEQGFVVSPTVSESTQPSLNDAALTMVEGFRYAPRFMDGRPVATAGIEHTENFSFASRTASLARPNLERPPIRGFMDVDFNDMSECEKVVPDDRVCAFTMPGVK